MVERDGERPDSSGVPTIAELLTAYRDRTGASYGDMARKVRDELQISRLQQLATAPPKEFPKRARTIELLAELLEVPVATIVLAFAKGLGIPVKGSGNLLADTLPPGTDVLTDEDRQAIRTVTRALVLARAAKEAFPELDDFPTGSVSHVTTIRPLSDEDVAPITGPEPATVHDYGLAARRGPSVGRAERDEQDAAGEAPDPEPDLD